MLFDLGQHCLYVRSLFCVQVRRHAATIVASVSPHNSDGGHSLIQAACR
jgi:hypothetical protein